MKEILLTQGKITLVDDEDYEDLSKFKWQMNNGYAVRRSGGTQEKMHRRIMKYKLTGHFNLIDHIDGNTLNNCKSNLRVCNLSQNMQNAVHPVGISGFRGVIPLKSSKYRAQIKIKGIRKHLGCFFTAEDAAEAYDTAAKELHGEFAVLNFPKKKG